MATAILTCISFVEVPSLLKVDSSYLKASTSSRFCLFIMMLMGTEVLMFILAASHEINIIRKTKITNWPSTYRYGGVEVLEGLLIFSRNMLAYSACMTCIGFSSNW